MNKKLFILLAFAVLAIIFYWSYAYQSRWNNKGNSDIPAGYLTGHISIGPFCPVEREGVPCPIPPGAYSSREVLIYKENGETIVKKVKIDDKGDYKTELEQGNYLVQVRPAGIGEGEKKRANIKSSQTNIVNFDIDTGIR